MGQERPRENRYPCHGTAALFLAATSKPATQTARLHGQLLDISTRGASLALAEIITDRKHLAYAPMESDLLKLYVVLPMEGEETILPVKTTWFNKKLSEESLPFRIGLEFLTPITPEQLKKIREPAPSPLIDDGQ